MQVEIISNPFYGTRNEHSGWTYIGKVKNINNDVIILGGVRYHIEDLAVNCYRPTQITQTMGMGDLAFIDAKSPFVGYLEYKYYDDDIETEIVCVINARTKKRVYVTLPKIHELIEVSQLDDLIGLNSVGTGKSKIAEVAYSDILVLNDLGKMHGVRTSLNHASLYEASYSLQSDGFNVSIIKDSLIPISGFDKIINLCRTLHFEVLLNDTDDERMWSIKDSNSKIFDFQQFLKSIGYEYIKG